MPFSKVYETPLTVRYASGEMAHLFSAHRRALTWRTLWLALAKGERELGLPIAAEQIEELKAHLNDLDEEECARQEEILEHDVMAHIAAFGKVCPKAQGILHLGATSCYVTDNGDLLLMREGLDLLLEKLHSVTVALAAFAKTHAQLPCLSFTHLQPAQPTTVGKRACLWLQDLLFDSKELKRLKENLPFLGVKGATGTQASFLKLFDGDAQKVEALDRFVAKEMGFEHVLTIASQTYPRKIDQMVVNALALLAASIHKMATDLRLLAHMGEMEEPFKKSQVGSSAMPYKRNPMRSERLCSLARYLLTLSQNPPATAASQWLERTLDDSAGRRCTLPEAFLTADALLSELLPLIQGLILYPEVIQGNLEREMPYLALENILMEAVKRGKDRQQTHELLRTMARAAKDRERRGERIDLLELLSKESGIGLTLQELKALTNIQEFIGLAPLQVHRFLQEEGF